MSRRLQWIEKATSREGGFSLQGERLCLLWAEGAAPDRLAQDPGERDGLVATIEDQELALAARGALRLFPLAEDGTVGVSCGKFRLSPGQGLAIDWASHEGAPRFELNFAATAVKEDPLIGREIGGYRILGRFGQGAMGVVYRALQLKLDREVALKILNPTVARQSPLAVASFKRESIAAGRLSHPNLVQVYDVGHDQGLHFYSMESVPGGDLEQRLKEQGPLSWEEAVPYLIDCADALAFAEEHHLVHRDVKPENLMLTLDGRAKLADLGMAATRNMLEQESAGGTPHFMAPECVGGGPIDGRADLYSLGCTMYRLLTGRTPFQGDSVREILKAHRDDPIPRLKDAGCDAPALAQDLLDRLMAKSPEDRPAHAREVAEILHQALSNPRSPLLFAALAVVAVGAIGTALYFAMRTPPVAEPEKVIVKVDDGAAQAAQEANAKLQRELAFTQAMAVAEGPERAAALEAFRQQYPDSDFTEQVASELARLAALAEAAPESDPDPAATAAEALAAQVAAFEADWKPLLASQRLGAAHHALATSALPTEALAPLWAHLEAEVERQFQAWEQAHQAALASQDFGAAAEVRRRVETALAGADPIPTAWTARQQALITAAAKAEAAAQREAFHQARLAFLATLNEAIRPAWDRLAYAAAAADLAQAAERCPHAELQAAITSRVEALEQAGRAADKLLAVVNSGSDLPVTEARDHKRAFAQGASADGLALTVQVRGERVPRVDPWPLFATAEDWRRFLDEVLGGVSSLAPDDLEALYLLHGMAQISRQMRAWADLPAADEAAIFAADAEAWIEGLRLAPSAQPAWMREEVAAVQDCAAFAQHLAAGEDYLAFQALRRLQQHFTLFAALLSDGTATWSMQP